MSEPDTSKWKEAVSATKAKRSSKLHGEGSGTKPAPEAVARIVRVAKERRSEWILSLWQSSALKALIIAAVAIGIAIVVLWSRDGKEKSKGAGTTSPIIPAPALDDLESLGKEEPKETP